MERREREKKIHRKIDTSMPSADSRENTAPPLWLLLSNDSSLIVPFVVPMAKQREQLFTVNIYGGAMIKTLFTYVFSINCCKRKKTPLHVPYVSKNRMNFVNYLARAKWKSVIFIGNFMHAWLYSKKKRKKKLRFERDGGNSTAVQRAGAAENKLNRLPALKHSKLFHPVQLTPPVYLTCREWIAEWSWQVSGLCYQCTIVATLVRYAFTRGTGACPVFNGNESKLLKKARKEGWNGVHRTD